MNFTFVNDCEISKPKQNTGKVYKDFLIANDKCAQKKLSLKRKSTTMNFQSSVKWWQNININNLRKSIDNSCFFWQQLLKWKRRVVLSWNDTEKALSLSRFMLQDYTFGMCIQTVNSSFVGNVKKIREVLSDSFFHDPGYWIWWKILYMFNIQCHP